jgi:hypothetical protein
MTLSAITAPSKIHLLRTLCKAFYSQKMGNLGIFQYAYGVRGASLDAVTSY